MDHPYGRHLPIFHTPGAPMSEFSAERWAERYTDRADREFMAGRATQEQYDAWTKALDAWVTRHTVRDARGFRSAR